MWGSCWTKMICWVASTLNFRLVLDVMHGIRSTMTWNIWVQWVPSMQNVVQKCRAFLPIVHSEPISPTNGIQRNVCTTMAISTEGVELQSQCTGAKEGLIALNFNWVARNSIRKDYIPDIHYQWTICTHLPMGYQWKLLVFHTSKDNCFNYLQHYGITRQKLLVSCCTKHILSR